jgi:hypothetical protein
LIWDNDISTPWLIPIVDVTAEIRQIDEGSMAGSCYTNGQNIRHGTIDQLFWNTALPLLRGIVIFY